MYYISNIRSPREPAAASLYFLKHYLLARSPHVMSAVMNQQREQMEAVFYYMCGPVHATGGTQHVTCDVM